MVYNKIKHLHFKLYIMTTLLIIAVSILSLFSFGCMVIIGNLAYERDQKLASRDSRIESLEESLLAAEAVTSNDVNLNEMRYFIEKGHLIGILVDKVFIKKNRYRCSGKEIYRNGIKVVKGKRWESDIRTNFGSLEEAKAQQVYLLEEEFNTKLLKIETQHNEA